MSARILVSLVTYNSGKHLKPCLEGLKAQSYRDFEIVILDNASRDATADTIEAYRSSFHSIQMSDRNLGFCAAHNRIIRSSDSEYVLVLNPDVMLHAQFMKLLVEAMDSQPSAGAATGKLYRWQTDPGKNTVPCVDEKTELDSTGIYFTRNQRHLDRGSGDAGSGKFDRLEFVFGASGAAAFYRRKMLEDIREENEYFDTSFFAYREDADLAWRAQWLGWRCLYVPGAVGFHERKVLPTGRTAVPDAINMHSFKNRFLMRIKNMDPGTYMRNFIPITIRDALAIGYVLLWEWSSLPAFRLFLRELPKALRNRRSLIIRRRIQPYEIRKWFTGKQSEPLES